jgi:hypothetical protein
MALIHVAFIKMAFAMLREDDKTRQKFMINAWNDTHRDAAEWCAERQDDAARNNANQLNQLMTMNDLHKIIARGEALLPVELPEGGA